ncbi:MAG: DUF4157 domain-containing protein [bacterium]
MDESDRIQVKLRVSQPNDNYEQEADLVAEQVMQMPESQVQRQKEEEEEPIQTKKAFNKTYFVNEKLTNINSLKSRGQPLQKSTRAFFEPRFGINLNSVRVHTDVNTNESARALNAQAFTTGRDIFFCQGTYNPGTSSGRELLAHELTHVVQQTGGLRRKMTPGHSEDIDEQEAKVGGVAIHSQANEGKLLHAKDESNSPLNSVEKRKRSDEFRQMDTKDVTSMPFNKMVSRSDTFPIAHKYPDLGQGLRSQEIKIQRDRFVSEGNREELEERLKGKLSATSFGPIIQQKVGHEGTKSEMKLLVPDEDFELIKKKAKRRYGWEKCEDISARPYLPTESANSKL